ncbi:hypothetical protein JOQ06_019635, partial [Pogonophryne albipinna]
VFFAFLSSPTDCSVLPSLRAPTLDYPSPTFDHSLPTLPCANITTECSTNPLLPCWLAPLHLNGWVFGYPPQNISGSPVLTRLHPSHPPCAVHAE